MANPGHMHTDKFHRLMAGVNRVADAAGGLGG